MGWGELGEEAAIQENSKEQAGGQDGKYGFFPFPE